MPGATPGTVTVWSATSSAGIVPQVRSTHTRAPCAVLIPRTDGQVQAHHATSPHHVPALAAGGTEVSVTLNKDVVGFAGGAGRFARHTAGSGGCGPRDDGEARGSATAACSAVPRRRRRRVRAATCGGGQAAETVKAAAIAITRTNPLPPR